MIINGTGELTERRQPASCLTQTQETQKHTTRNGWSGPRAGPGAVVVSSELARDRAARLL